MKNRASVPPSAGHTPGRWVVSKSSHQHEWGFWIDTESPKNQRGVLVAAVAMRLESEANARLIAAAPEMFKELDAILAALEDGETVTIDPGSVKAERIRTALSRASGEEVRRG